MAALRHGTAWTSLDGRRHDLGAYKHDAQAGLATDLANLLQAHILAREGGSATPQPKLSVLPAASLSDLSEREDWAELRGQAALEQAIRGLAESRLAEQLYYDLFSVETSEDEDMEEAEQAAEQQPQQQPQQQQPAPPQQQQPQQHTEQNSGQAQGELHQDGAAEDASTAGGEGSLADDRLESIESIEDGELVGARLPSGLPAEQSAPPAQQPKAEPAEPAPAQAGLATDGLPTPAAPVAEAAAAAGDAEMEAESGFEAEDAAAALQHLAALPSAAWQDGASGGEASEGEGGWAPGRKRSRTVRAPPERKQRKQRPAKLWCRYPLDESRWALILSSSAISSRQISLPWTQPGDMACELLGTAWVEAVRRRTQSGTVRETAVLLLDDEEGERAVSYALYQNTGASQKETRPQYLEKLHPVLQARAAAVGDVLLLLPVGPGRLQARLVKSNSEEARAVHAAMSFDVPGEQQAWQSKHPSRQPSRASSQHDLTHLEASPGAAAAAAAAAAGAAELAGAALSPPLPAQAAEGRQPSPAPPHAAHRQEHASPAGRPATATAHRQALEQAAAADALEEMMPPHKRPKWEHPSDGSPPQPAAAAAGTATLPPGQEVHRKPSGLSALLQHPASMGQPPLPPAQQVQLRQAVMRQQMQHQIARVSAAQRHAQALNAPGGAQRPPAAAAGVIDTMAMGQSQLAMLQQYRSRLKEGSKEYEECSAHIASLQASMQHLSKFAKPPAPAAAAAPQPAALPPAAARPPAPASLQQQMHQKAPALRPQQPPQRAPMVPVLPKQSVPLPARPPGQRPAAMRQVQVMVAGRPMSMLVPAGMEGRLMQDMARMSAFMAGQPQQAAAMVAAMQQAAAAAAAAAPRPAQPAGVPTAQPVKPATGAAAAPVAAASATAPPAVQVQAPVGPAASAQPASQPVRPSSPGSQQAPPPHPTVSTPPPKPAAAPPVAPAAASGAVQVARPAGNAPVVMMSKPLLIRSTPVPAVAPAPAPKPAQHTQQPAGGAAAAAPLPRPSAPAAALSPAAQQATTAGALQAQAPAQPVPDASVSLAHMQAALHSFAAGVAVRVPPGEEQRQRVNERLHALAGELDALLKGFWQQQGAK